VLGKAPILFDRSDSYIGVMIDDLTLQGVTEPYRMLTARAEYRLRLRADNADARLTPFAIAAGCVTEERQRAFGAWQAEREAIEDLLAARHSAAELNQAAVGVRDEGGKRTLAGWIRFPEVDADALLRIAPALAGHSRAVLDEAVQDHRYAPYLIRQQGEIARLKADEAVRIPTDLDYRAIAGLSNEMVERLLTTRPPTLGAAGRIRGITPAALAAILVHARRKAA
jgi:tRNA uridine 5-carboxymethylaminomethyl modification enzyme